MTESELLYGNRCADDDGNERYMEVDELLHHCSPCFLTNRSYRILPPRIEPDPLAVKLLNKAPRKRKEV